ncbi:MAG: hypothetical protein CL916_01055 [Deltaproteobacteria bacterium]|nr:hypothetical protein [Deltaproteobacteria bacterium]
MFLFFLMSAMADESPPQEVFLSEDIPLFTDVGLDSGWVPNSGTLSVRLQLLANGNMMVEETGSAHLFWPEDLQLQFMGIEDGGVLDLETILATVVSIKFDIAGYQYEAPISTFDVPITATEVFDSFSIGSPISLEIESNSNIIDVTNTVLFVVDFNFYGNVRPSISLDFHPLQWDVDDEIIEEEEGTASFSPEIGAPIWNGEGRHLAEIDAQLDVNFVPTFEVCVPIVGCRQWEPIDIPLSSNNDAFIHEFSPVSLSFPLPALSYEDEVIDFGVLDPQNLANHQFIVGNLGEMLLSGTARIVSGEEYFSVFPENFLANIEDQDGIMVSFLGADEGTYEGVLEIVSNDPAQPSIQIALQAQVEQEEEVGGKEIEGDMVGGCGCSSQKNPPFSLLFLFPALVLFRRKQ